MNRRPPKIVEKYVFDGCVRPQVPVVFDSANVIENESTLQAVVIADNAGDDDDQTEPRLHPHARSSAGTKWKKKSIDNEKQYIQIKQQKTEKEKKKPEEVASGDSRAMLTSPHIIFAFMWGGQEEYFSQLFTQRGS